MVCSSDNNFGLMSPYSREELREIITRLQSAGPVSRGNHEIISLTPAAAEVLFRDSLSPERWTRAN